MEQLTSIGKIIEEQHLPTRTVRLLRLPDVMARVGVKRSMIYRLMSEGRFPKSRSLGAKCTVWVESEIEDWIKSIVGNAQ